MALRTRYLIIVFALLLGGCDSLTRSEFQPEYVIEAYLEAGQNLPQIRVSRTAPVNASYNIEELGVNEAQVRVHLLGRDGSIETTYTYGRHHKRESGVYDFVNGRVEVLPLRTYRLEVEIPGGTLISSQTTVPDRIRVIHVSADTVVFQAEPRYTFDLSPPTYPGRQSVFVFSTFATGDVDDLTPFARSLFDSGDVTIEDLRQRTSPVLNEENFERLPNGALRIEFPWLAIYFFGRNEVRVQALDDNLHDFIRSQMVQQGGSTLPPGEIPNVLEHVEGGHGVFGSFASATAVVYVERNDALTKSSPGVRPAYGR